MDLQERPLFILQVCPILHDDAFNEKENVQSNGEPHQLDHEEVFVILEGSLTITIDGQAFDLGAGDALAVPARSLLSVANRTSAKASALVCIQAGFRATMASGEEIGTPPWAV